MVGGEEKPMTNRECYIQYHCRVSEHIRGSLVQKNLNKDLQLKLHGSVIVLGHSFLRIPNIVSGAQFLLTLAEYSQVPNQKTLYHANPAPAKVIDHKNLLNNQCLAQTNLNVRISFIGQNNNKDMHT